MKNDLVTSIFVAILGFVGAYFICNLFAGEIKPFAIKTLDTSVPADIAAPNPEVFNYRALNPTVEVYVGDCAEYDANGECINEGTSQIDQNTIIDELEKDDTSNGGQ